MRVFFFLNIRNTVNSKNSKFSLPANILKCVVEKFIEKRFQQIIEIQANENDLITLKAAKLLCNIYYSLKIFKSKHRLVEKL